MENMTDEYIKPDYETISAVEKSQLAELMESSLLNGFTRQDYLDVIAIFSRVCDRLMPTEEEV